MSSIKWLFQKLISLFNGKKLPHQAYLKEPLTESVTSQILSAAIPDFTTQFVDSIPNDEEIQKNIVYIVGDKGFEWLVALQCPCGCGELVQLNLLQNTRPSWRISISNGDLITITPSIERIVGCKSHFTLTNGQITWWPNYYY